MCHLLPRDVSGVWRDDKYLIRMRDWSVGIRFIHCDISNGGFMAGWKILMRIDCGFRRWAKSASESCLFGSWADERDRSLKLVFAKWALKDFSLGFDVGCWKCERRLKICIVSVEFEVVFFYVAVVCRVVIWYPRKEHVLFFLLN